MGRGESDRSGRELSGRGIGVTSDRARNDLSGRDRCVQSGRGCDCENCGRELSDYVGCGRECGCEQSGYEPSGRGSFGCWISYSLIVFYVK